MKIPTLNVQWPTPEMPGHVSCPDCGQVLGAALPNDKVSELFRRCLTHHACHKTETVLEFGKGEKK